MTSKHYTLIRIAGTLVLGVLLIMLREQAASLLVACIGAIFLLSGAGTLVVFFLKKNDTKTFSHNEDAADKNYFPVVSGGGSLLFGLWLLIAPSFFVGIMMFLLAAMLILLGLYQIAVLVKAAKTLKVQTAFFVLPVIILLAGIFVLFNPFEAASLPFLIMGVAAVAYSVIDFVNYWVYTKNLN